jgi:hypothetical protein
MNYLHYPWLKDYFSETILKLTGCFTRVQAYTNAPALTCAIYKTAGDRRWYYNQTGFFPDAASLEKFALPKIIFIFIEKYF